MREIKFRAWHKTKKVMLGSAGLDEMLVGANKMPKCKDDSDEIEWMQYTNLKDSKGVEIYEGDVFVCSDKKIADTHWVVKMIDGCWVGDSGEKSNTALHHYLTHGVTKEVIGNRYENPELIN